MGAGGFRLRAAAPATKEWRQDASRRDHQDRQRSSSPRAHRSRVDLPASAADLRRPTSTPRKHRGAREGDRLETPTQAPSSLSTTCRKRPATPEGGDRRGVRAARLHLGHRRARRASASRDIFLTQHPCIIRSHRPDSDRGHDDKENPRASYAVGSRPESARVVRDSSRRITTMKASSRSILESQTDQSSTLRLLDRCLIGTSEKRKKRSSGFQRNL